MCVSGDGRGGTGTSESGPVGGVGGPTREVEMGDFQEGVEPQTSREGSVSH